jgi:PadR family transcriptional regulator, regulatory protein PadR
MARKDEQVLTMLEWLLMAAILSNDNNAYGSIIYDTARDLARPASVSYGSLYPTLERLERQGFVTSAFSQPLQERGGRSRRYFSITASGKKVMKSSESLAVRISGKQLEAWGHS